MVYLDYASTAPCVKFPCSKYGQFLNPNANYAHKEKQLLKDCENRIKRAIGAKGGKVLFGGTSSQLIENLYFTMSNNSLHQPYLTTGSIYEHESMFGFVDQWGKLDSLKQTIETYNRPKQLIIMLQGMNNITGQIMPIVEMGRLCREYGAVFICDLTAHIGHAAIPDDIDEWADCVLWSGHKLGTDCGVGCMWLSDRFNTWLGDITLHGTPNLAGALAICDATEWAVKDMDDKLTFGSDRYCHLLNQLDLYEIEHKDIVYSGEYSPFINAIRLPGINADALQQYAASHDCYIGIGHSSCSANEDWRVLCNGYGLTKREASEVIRVSFGEDTTYEDIDCLVELIKEFRGLFA